MTRFGRPDGSDPTTSTSNVVRRFSKIAPTTTMSAAGTTGETRFTPRSTIRQPIPTSNVFRSKLPISAAMFLMAGTEPIPASVDSKHCRNLTDDHRQSNSRQVPKTDRTRNQIGKEPRAER